MKRLVVAASLAGMMGASVSSMALADEKGDAMVAMADGLAIEFVCRSWVVDTNQMAALMENHGIDYGSSEDKLIRALAKEKIAIYSQLGKAAACAEATLRYGPDGKIMARLMLAK